MINILFLISVLISNDFSSFCLNNENKIIVNKLSSDIGFNLFFYYKNTIISNNSVNFNKSREKATIVLFKDIKDDFDFYKVELIIPYASQLFLNIFEETLFKKILFNIKIIQSIKDFNNLDYYKDDYLISSELINCYIINSSNITINKDKTLTIKTETFDLKKFL